MHATSRFLLRDSKLTQLNWNTNYSVGGHQIHLTNRDGSLTMAAVYMHNQKLKIIEGTAPKGEAEPDSSAVVRMDRRERREHPLSVAVPSRVPGAAAGRPAR